MPTIIHHLIILDIAAATAGAAGRWKAWKGASSRPRIIQQSTFALVMYPHVGDEGVATEE